MGGKKDVIVLISLLDEVVVGLFFALCGGVTFVACDMWYGC